ncbi:MAG: ribonuclease HI [Candidatus Viridilinea halotolerans]|uniref:Ribonuclease H n=1 Tax=Candidatus Viridilinea halotolerans TaxID=2491704 RepID=A0A426U486_9CHLR|nr:MAG: ribonuclease HI [Candidatus Viridilinea halotolerans]
MSKRKFYAIVVGRKPGLYDEWFGPDGAEAQIKGFPKAIYKSFQAQSEAEAWYRQKTGGEEPTPQQLAPRAPVADYFRLHTEALAAGKVVIYTDGGCHQNPGKGGYGAVLLHRTAKRKELLGGYACTTSNRMELMACIAGLQALHNTSSVVIFSDSAYVVDALTKGWAHNWRKNGWQRKEQGELVPLRNADLWQTLVALCAKHEVSFVKVRGHAGSGENDRCHELAAMAMAQTELPPDAGFTSGN